MSILLRGQQPWTLHCSRISWTPPRAHTGPTVTGVERKSTARQGANAALSCPPLVRCGLQRYRCKRDTGGGSGGNHAAFPDVTAASKISGRRRLRAMPVALDTLERFVMSTLVAPLSHRRYVDLLTPQRAAASVMVRFLASRNCENGFVMAA